MPQIGQTIAHYRIVEKIGEGGMGVVYRAEDTTLSRHVAIKVLPGQFADDPERLARFEREAKVLASLNHPNSAVIYGLEQADGKRLIVMELVEGETLAHRLLKGPLPVDEALGVCRQIAEGLEAAHEKGVVHRDLKPGNVMLTRADRVKILDFGLARVFTDVASDVNQTHSPTITEAMTRAGTILGTAAYMSPEQAKGKAVDKRTDIWAFGCVLYECLTGTAPFSGDTVTETLARILEGSPDWSRLPAATPPTARKLLLRCLQKNPTDRQRDIGDARMDLLDNSIDSLPAVATGSNWRSRVLMAAIGLLLVATTALTARWYWRPSGVMLSVRSAFRIGQGYWLAGRSGRFQRWRPIDPALALSRDGTFIVYSVLPENPGAQAKSQIFLRRMDQMTGTPVAGTEGGTNPFLSPDDRWLGFSAQGKLTRVAVEGGMPTTLCSALRLFGADWGGDNAITFCPSETLGLFRISADGGEPELLTRPDPGRGEYGHRLPHSLPGGRGVLFTIVSRGEDMQPSLALLDPRTREWRTLLTDAADGRYVSSGHLIFLRQGTLMAVAFDLRRLELRGRPVPVVANVMQALNSGNTWTSKGAGQFTISDSGWLAYIPGGIFRDQENSLVHVDQQGRVEPVSRFKDAFMAPRYSPDGRRIVYTTSTKEQRVWIYDLEREARAPLTASEGACGFPIWTPDGKKVVFSWIKSYREDIRWQAVDGGYPMQPLLSGDKDQVPGSFSPDGSTLAFLSYDPKTADDILLLDMKTGAVKPFLQTGAREIYPEFSPDGRWLAYVQQEPRRQEVWVSSYPAGEGRWQVSVNGGAEPIWSRDGKQLFYRQADKVLVADIRTEHGFSASKPRLLFDIPGFMTSGPTRSWDLAPDGRSFLMVKLEEAKPEPATEILFVQNWFEELKRLVSTGKR